MNTSLFFFLSRTMQMSYIFILKIEEEPVPLQATTLTQQRVVIQYITKTKYMIYANRVGTIIFMLGVCLCVQAFLLFERKGYAFSCYNP